MTERTDDLPVTMQMPTPAGRAPARPTFIPGQRKHPGRPRHLTRDVQDRFMTALRAGNSIADAARYAGLKPDTVEKWLRRGRGVHTQLPPTPEYVEFHRLTEESRAAARVYVVGNVVARSRVDTRAAEMWLRVHGGPEWRDDEPAAASAPAATPSGPTYVDQKVLIVPADQVRDVVHRMLVARREAMPVEPIPVEEERRPDGPSRARASGLREDG